MSTADLDGVIAAPDHHKVIFENDVVRVLETTIRAGDITPLHTHLTPTVVYVISHAEGQVHQDERVRVERLGQRMMFATSQTPTILDWTTMNFQLPMNPVMASANRAPSGASSMRA